MLKMKEDVAFLQYDGTYESCLCSHCLKDHNYITEYAAEREDLMTTTNICFK